MRVGDCIVFVDPFSAQLAHHAVSGTIRSRRGQYFRRTSQPRCWQQLAGGECSLDWGLL